jgi:hypothetical protein
MPEQPDRLEVALQALFDLVETYGGERLQQQQEMWGQIEDAMVEVVDAGLDQGRREAERQFVALIVAKLGHRVGGIPADGPHTVDLSESALDLALTTVRDLGRREATEGWDRAVATLRDVAARTGSPAARWAAEYLAADPDARRVGPWEPAEQPESHPAGTVVPLRVGAFSQPLPPIPDECYGPDAVPLTVEYAPAPAVNAEQPEHAFDESSVINPATGQPYRGSTGPEPYEPPDPLCVCGGSWSGDDGCETTQPGWTPPPPCDGPSIEELLPAEQPEAARGGTVAPKPPADTSWIRTTAAEQHEDGECPDCLCCTRRACATQRCGACPCTEG